VPLLPDEVAGLLSGQPIVPGVGPEDEEVARLLARGTPLSDIAHKLGISRRTVDRRVARLREHFSARSKAELATVLASRGF
jgi:DNA-binding NarL/FixJ family response regulator